MGIRQSGPYHYKALVKPGIRIKFIGILMLAAMLPLLVAAGAVYVLGNKYYRESAGEIFQNRAQQMGNYLELSVTAHADALFGQLALGIFHERIEAMNEERRQLPQVEIREEIEQMERKWADLSEESPELRALLENDMAQTLKELQTISSPFVEIFVTDNVGRLVASTGKTTNYWHAFKPWWQIGMQKPFGETYIEGVNYDESSGVYSFDIIIPIRDWRDPAGLPVGVAKGVIDASPLFFDLAGTVGDGIDWKVVLEDGSVLFGPIPIERRVPERVREILPRFDNGWMLRTLREGEERRMIGFITLPWMSTLAVRNEEELEIPPRMTRDAVPMVDSLVRELGEEDLWDPAKWEPTQKIYVLLHADATEVLAPIRAHLLLITGTGALFVLGCFVVGYYLAQYHIIRPINLLQAAAREIASSAKLKRGPESPGALAEVSLSPATRKLLSGVLRFQSEDELGELAKDFSLMAQRVLSYHAHLEAEINTKVAEIQGDLVIAREFQEALMPNDYPRVPDNASPDSPSLKFNHIYKPASTVGGDFFNVIKLSDDRAGVFIADVMGHGSRSALVTAIVATLLHDLAPKSSDPAQFMAALNRHFHHLIQHSKQVIFVTAFYIVIDTREQVAQFASAGHPSPLLVQRHKGVVKPLIHAMQNDTALGLIEESTYACFSRPISEDDMFLLFTDGLFEAINPRGEEFGIQKLIDVVNRNLEFSAAELGRRILETVERYGGFAAQGDDICLVSVEVNPPSAVSETARSDSHRHRNQI